MRSFKFQISNKENALKIPMCRREDNTGMCSCGYAALGVVLIVMFLITTIGVYLTFFSVSELQIFESVFNKEKALYLVESCAEESLLQFVQNGKFPAEISFPEGKCFLSLISNTNDMVNFQVRGYIGLQSKIIHVKAQKLERWRFVEWTEIF